MKWIRYSLVLILASVSLGFTTDEPGATEVVSPAVPPDAPAKSQNGQPTALAQSAEVLELLRQYFVDRDMLNLEALDAGSVDGILGRLGGGAKVLTAEQVAATTDVIPADAKTLARAEIIEPDIGYVRVSRVVADTPTALDIELKKFASAKVIGFVLDLRFASGQDYDAARAVAGRFLSDGQSLFSIKRAAVAPEVFHAQRVRDGRQQAQWQEAPLMILINQQTRGSAEAVAGALRSQSRGILIGQPTAGSAVDWKDLPLRDGRTLRLATAKLMLPSLDKPPEMTMSVFPDGVPPDIKVKMDPKTEREVVLEIDDGLSLTATLKPVLTKKGMNEADLVRAHRGETVETEPVKPEAETQPAGEVRDLVLQRAVDIMKGIRVFLSWR